MTDPLIRQRANGSWLAQAAPSDRFRIAVVADTQAGARQQYSLEYEAWERLLAAALRGDADRAAAQAG